MTQYAVDTSLIFDDFPKVMEWILRDLDYYASMSGLKINFLKTKLVCICSKVEKYHL